MIKNADMSEDMQQDSVDCATQAMEKYNIEKDIAAYIKKVRADRTVHSRAYLSVPAHLVPFVHSVAGLPTSDCENPVDHSFIHNNHSLNLCMIARTAQIF